MHPSRVCSLLAGGDGAPPSAFNSLGFHPFSRRGGDSRARCRDSRFLSSCRSCSHSPWSLAALLCRIVCAMASAQADAGRNITAIRDTPFI